MSCPFGHGRSSAADSAPASATSGFASCPIVRSGGLDIDIEFPPSTTAVPVRNLMPELTPPDLISVLHATKAAPDLENASEYEVVHKKSNSVIQNHVRLKSIVQSGDVLLVRRKQQGYRNVRLWLDKENYMDFPKAHAGMHIKDLMLIALLERRIRMPKTRIDELVLRYRGRNLDIATAQVGADLEDEPDECLISIYCFAPTDQQTRADRAWNLVYMLSGVLLVVALAVMYMLLSGKMSNASSSTASRDL